MRVSGLNDGYSRIYDTPSELNNQQSSAENNYSSQTGTTNDNGQGQGYFKYSEGSFSAKDLDPSSPGLFGPDDRLFVDPDGPGGEPAIDSSDGHQAEVG